MSKLSINLKEKELSEIIIFSIKNKLPLYHLRCGDGEMIMMLKNDINTFNLFSKNYFGYIIDDVTNNEIKNNLMKAISLSDIIGLPEKYHKDKEINKYWNIIESVYLDIFVKYKINYEDKKYCSIDSHLKLLKSGLLDDIINNSDEITLITSRNIKTKFLKKYKHLKNVNLFIIPGEQKYEPNPIKSNFFPFVHQEIKDKIESCDRSGQLCLYGTGYGGKDLGLYFRNMGGVSIDIGSVFDIWEGKITRGKNKGSTSFFNDNDENFKYVL